MANTTTPRCPFCDDDDCRHFIGWTEDGRTMEPRNPFPADAAPRIVLDTDVCLNTGVSTRVYRDWVFP